MAWQNLKKDNILQGTKDDIEFMMQEMKDIMSMRMEQAIKESAGSATLRVIRQRIGDGLQTWMSQRWANEYVSTMSDELEHVDLGVSG